MLDPHILSLLQGVKDPEIPTVSVVDLGIIEQAEQRPDGTVYVEMLPTFAGCPALSFMSLQIEEALKAAGITRMEVVVNKLKAWDSNRLTDAGRQGLLDFGLSPPPRYTNDDYSLEAALCPRCGSTHTQLQSPFGPTLCRAIHRCLDCGETFEQFKPV